MRRAPAGGRDRATRVAEVRAPAKPLQNHLEPAAALLDRRQLQTHLRLPQERFHDQLLHQSPNRGATGTLLVKVFLAVKRKNYAQRQAVLFV